MIVNDHWTLELDKLGMRGVAEELSATALRARPPFAIGVFGKWGSGKTSLMRYAMARLGGAPLAVTLRSAPSEPLTELPPELAYGWEQLRDRASDYVLESLQEQLPAGAAAVSAAEVNVLPVWFNPWLHQSSASPLVPLLHELAAQGTAFQRFQAGTRKISTTALESAVDLLFSLAESATGLLGAPAGGLSGVPDRARRHLDSYERSNFQSASEAQRFNLLFEAAVARLLGEDVDSSADAVPGSAPSPRLVTRRLVVFVDDLDRCEEQQVVKLLEAIKLYLQTRNCVFVLGLDEGAVRRSVRRVWDGRSSQEAQDYLDKLFQAVVYVPSGHRYGAFVDDLLDGWGINDGVADCAARINDLVERNPRKVKNFVNSLMLAWRASGLGRSDEVWRAPSEAFLLFHYLRVYHPDVSRLLQHDLAYLDDLHTVIADPNQLAVENASPVAIFMSRQLRHAREKVPLNKQDQGKGVADELLERLDRHRGDRNFLAAWEARYVARPQDGGVGVVPRADPELVDAIGAGRRDG